MTDAHADPVLAAPLLLVGAVLLVLGARYLRRAGLPWRAAARSPAALLAAGGVLLLATGALFAVGFPDAAVVVLEAVGALAGLGMAAAAVRAARAGRLRDAAGLGATALAVLVFVALLALELQTAVDVAVAVLAGGLLALSAVAITRRWSRSDTAQRFLLVQSLALGVGLSAQAAAQLLPRPLHTLGTVLSSAGLAAALVAVGMIFVRRRYA